MGQAPASGRNSLRTVPRNFPGRSGAEEDSVWLCSPETAAAAALTGVITDPRDLDADYPRLELPRQTQVNTAMLVAPVPADDARGQELVKGPNIASLPEFDPLPDHLEATAELKVADNISTDEILPAAPRCCRCAATSPRSPGSRSGSSTRTTRTVPPPRRARTWWSPARTTAKGRRASTL